MDIKWKKNHIEYLIVFKYIENKSEGINYELLETHFSFAGPTNLAKQLFETKDKKKNNDLVKLIMVKWNILKDEMKKCLKMKKKLKNRIKY